MDNRYQIALQVAAQKRRLLPTAALKKTQAVSVAAVKEASPTRNK